MTAPVPTPGRRPLTRAVAGTCALILGLVLLTGGGDDTARHVHASSHSAFDQDLWLTTDAGASALFHATNLAPGATITRCIAVAQGGTDTPATLRLHGTGTGTLAQHVHLRIESGTGGGAAGCQGFAGVIRFSDSLASFFATHRSPATGLRVGDLDGGGGSTTFRFTLTVDGEQAPQAASTTATFAWVASAPGTSPPAPTGTPTVAAPPPAGPAPQRVPAPAAPAAAPPRPAEPAPEAPVTADEPTRERPTAPPPDQPDDDAGAGAGPGPTVTSADEQPAVVMSTWRTWLGRAGTIAREVAERASIPIGLWLVVVLFLAIQDLIDRRDPKLALAQKESEPYLEFIPPPTERGGS